MASYRDRRWLVEPPHAATYVLLTVNVFVFALCLRGSSSTDISSEVLFLNGAMYSQALAWHEYWRLIAADFLHADPLHLVANMLYLVLWGGPLEKRVGSLYFLVIYFGAVGSLLDTVCANWPVALGAIAVGAFGLTFLLYAQEFQRGVADVGFVGATMVAERRRRQGL